MTMRRSAVLVGVAFSTALAIVVGNRLSTDAIALVVGIASGVLASIPTSLLLVWALTRRSQGPEHNSDPGLLGRTHQQYPPVVVVNPSGGIWGSNHGVPGWAASSTYSHGPAYPAPGEQQRAFRVMGDEDTIDRELTW